MQKRAYSSQSTPFKQFFAPLPTASESAIYYDREPISLCYSTDFTKLHFHDRYEIGFCEEGEGLICSNGVFSSFAQGEILFIPPNQAHYAHALYADRPCRLRFYYIAPSALPHLANCQDRLAATLECIPSVLRESEHPQAVATLGGILHNGSLSESKKAAILLRTATFLIEAASLFPSPLSADSASHIPSNEATQLAEFLSLHYRDHTTAAELSALFHLSESQMRRKFVSEYGIPPISYRNTLRCKIASELLLRTDLSITQISERVGYLSPSDFYRSFRKNRGISPSEYRTKRKMG